MVCKPVPVTTKAACRGVLPFELVREDGAGLKNSFALCFGGTQGLWQRITRVDLVVPIPSGYALQGIKVFLTRVADRLFDKPPSARRPSFWLFFAACVVASTASSVF